VKYVRYVFRVSMQAFDKFLVDDGWAIASHIALSALMALFRQGGRTDARHLAGPGGERHRR
jgi:hypothetical protein